MLRDVRQSSINQRVRWHSDNVLTLQQDLSPVRFQETVDGLQKGRLPDAIRAKNTGHLIGASADIYTLQNVEVLLGADVKVFDLKHVTVIHPPAPRFLPLPPLRRDMLQSRLGPA